MKQEEKNKIEVLKNRMREHFSSDTTGHDWWHLERVLKLSLHLAQQEKVRNTFIIAAAAILHDLEDWKLPTTTNLDKLPKTRAILTELSFSTKEIQSIIEIIKHISFKGAGVADTMLSLEGKIVQDADRLDAIGAIGIGRAFAYGGSAQRPMYDPSSEATFHDNFQAYQHSNSATLNHFYEKLFLLKDRLHTPTARRIAQRRHQIMVDFVENFLSEWNGTDF